MTVLGMVAQLERRFIKERQREGIHKAKANGVYQGGKGKVAKLFVTGMGVAQIADEVGCSRMQVYRLLKIQTNSFD